jgi:hypothetical protein
VVVAINLKTRRILLLLVVVVVGVKKLNMFHLMMATMFLIVYCPQILVVTNMEVLVS